MTPIEFVGLAIGLISLTIAVIAELRSARVKQALEVQLSQIKESNASIVERAYDNARNPNERIHEIQILATNQKREINGLFRAIKYRYWDTWKELEQ